MTTRPAPSAALLAVFVGLIRLGLGLAKGGVLAYLMSQQLRKFGADAFIVDVLGIALIRFTWRKTTRLPDWAATLAPWEKKLIHWYENALYTALFVMPLSGYLFVEAGGFGVDFFGGGRLPSFLPRNESLALLGEWTHIITGYVIVVVLTLHIGLVIKHQIVDKDRLLHRMLPFGK